MDKAAEVYPPRDFHRSFVGDVVRSGSCVSRTKDFQTNPAREASRHLFTCDPWMDAPHTSCRAPGRRAVKRLTGRNNVQACTLR